MRSLLHRAGGEVGEAFAEMAGSLAPAQLLIKEDPGQETSYPEAKKPRGLCWGRGSTGGAQARGCHS